MQKAEKGALTSSELGRPVLSAGPTAGWVPLSSIRGVSLRKFKPESVVIPSYTTEEV